MDIPSLFMIPSAVSSGKVHSVFPNSTDADFDFNRDSDATRVNSEGLIERVGYYGSELVTNGGFDTDSNWSKDGWKIENGKAINTLASSGLNLYQGGVTSVGNTFKVVLDAVISAGGLKVLLGGGSGGYNEIGQASSTGTHTFTGVSNGTDNRILIQTLSGSTIGSVIVDNVSVKQVNGDRARLNYEIEGGLVNTKCSLLLEPQSTNLITYSEDFTQSDWVKLGIGSGSSPILTKNYAISPDGSKNATRLQCNLNSGTTNSDQSLIYDLYSSSSNQTISIYMKSNTGSNQNVYFANTVSTGDTAVVTSEWQRFTFSHSSSTYVLAVGLRGGTGADDTLDISIFAAQAEALSYATSYIPTNGSTQTRAAETCNGAGTSSILPSEEGILYAEIEALANDGTLRLITLGDNSSSNAVSIQLANPNQITLYVNSGGVNQCAIVASVTTLAYNKCAIRYKQNNFSAYVNGTKVGVDTSGSTFASGALNRINFDIGYSSTSAFYGKIRDIRVYNTKEMTDSEVDILLTKITS